MSQISADEQRLFQALEKQQSELITIVDDLKRAAQTGNVKDFLRDLERLKASDRHYRLRHKNRLNALSQKKWLNFEQSSHLRLAKAQNECLQNILSGIDKILDGRELDASIGDYLHTQFVGPMEFELQKLAPLYAEAMQTDQK